MLYFLFSSSIRTTISKLDVSSDVCPSDLAVIEDSSSNFTHIFICLDEDYIDLMEGIELSEIFEDTPIYMNFTDENIEQTLMIATTKTKKSLYSAGMKQDILTKDYLNI